MPLNTVTAGANDQADANQAAIAARLDGLYKELTGFSESEVELLEEAGLLLTPEMPEI